MPATDADGFEIVQPHAAQLDPDGFEIVQRAPDAPQVDSDGFEIVRPSINRVLERPPIDARTPGEKFGPGAQVGPPTIRTLMGADIPGPNNLERPRYDYDEIDKAVDAFKNSRIGQTLLGQGQPEDSPASDIQRHGLVSLLGIPGRIGNTTGTGAQALVGDAASALRGENGGNVKAFLNRDGLPIVQAAADAKAEAKDQGQTGWESVVADISLGLADLAPKVAMLEGAPGAGLAKAGAAASIFGTDEKGNIDPKNAAFAAAFPWAMRLTSEVTEKAIQGAVDRGLTWAGAPATSKALHIAANQASMDALMTAQASPELANLMETDPQEFKRQIAKILGSNLAFAIPEALKTHGAPPSGPDGIAPAGQPPAEPRPPVPEPPAASNSQISDRLKAIDGTLAKFEQEYGPRDRFDTEKGKALPARILHTLEQQLLDARDRLSEAAEPPKPATPPEPTPEVTRDLIAELKASLEKRQIVKPPEIPESKIILPPSPPKADVVELDSMSDPASWKIGSAVDFTTGGERLDGTLVATEKDALIVEDKDGHRTRVIAKTIIPVTAEKAAEPPPSEYTREDIRKAWAEPEPKESPQPPSNPTEPAPPAQETPIIPNKGTQTELAGRGEVPTEEKPAASGSEELNPVIQAEAGRPEETLAPAAEEVKPEEQQGFAAWLDRAIEATRPGTGWTGHTSMGVARIPGWLTQEAVHGTLRIVRKAYQATGKLADAIESGVAWLYEQDIKGFNMDEAYAWLTDAVKGAKEVVERVPESAPKEPEAPAEPSREVPPTGPRDWRTVKSEMESASEELRQAIHSHMENGGAELKNAKHIAAAKYHLLKDELLTNRDYAADLLIRHEQALKDGDTVEVGNLRASLEELSPKVINSVHSELQANGKIAKSAPPPQYGRSLDQLTDWLKREGVDSPKLTLKDRLQRIADRWSDKWQAGKTTLDSTRMKIMAAWKTAVKNYKAPPTDTGFRNVIKDWGFAEQWTGHQTRRWMHELKRQVQNPLRRKAISVWMDANGDEGTLRYQSSAVPEKYKGIWDTALRLTDSEKALARQIKQDFAAKLEDAMNAGLIEKGREDYGVPQVWRVAPEVDPAIAAQGKQGSPGNPNAKLDPRSPFFSFERSHPSYFEGIMHGGDPRSLDIADLVGVYNEAFHKSLAGRAMIAALKNELAADGQPIIKLSGAVRQVSENEPGAYLVDSKARTGGETSADGRPYRSIDHFALRDWKVGNKTPEGKTIVVRGDMLVHPDHYEFLKNELMPSPLREGAAGRVINPIMNAGTFMKASKMAFAGFHLMTIGEHVASHLANPFINGFEIDLRQPDQALLVRNGLEIGMAGQRMAFEEGLASHGGLFRHVPGLGEQSARLTDWMFQHYIPTISMKLGLKALARNRRRYAGKLTDSQIAELTGQQMNAAVGLQNYRLLGRNKILMDLSRMALLAPQFLESRAKVIGQAFKPYGAEQRKMLIVQAGILYAGARVLNAMLDDDPHWELKAAFGVVHNGRMYSIRSIMGDMWHALSDPKSFAAGRLSPQLKIAIETLTQRDMRTGARKEPPIQTEWMPGRIAQNLVMDVVNWINPIGSEAYMPGAAGREQTKIASAESMVGIGSHKYTAQSQVFDWAKDFNRKSPDPATRTWQRHRDADAHGESAYRKLNALLDADKINDARTEYEALLKDGHTEKQLAQHYRHFANQAFTGNRQRETDFKATLSARQMKTYEKALAEQQALSDKFNKMLPEAVAP